MKLASLVSIGGIAAAAFFIFSSCPYRAVAKVILGRTDCGIAATCRAERENAGRDQERLAALRAISVVKQESGQRLMKTPVGELWFPGADDGDVAYTVMENQEDTYEGIVRSGDVVIDVGAHIGTFARRALAQGASRVISIEASPATAESLRRNLAEPIQAGKSSVFENAAWSSKGTLKFYTGGNMGDTTMDRGGREITVQSDTIDSIVEGLGLTRVDLIKMDIEGAEVDALKGAAGVIRRFGPRLLIATEHRPEDLTAIPALITTIRPYARQTPGPCILQPMRARVAPEFLLFQ